MLDLFTYFVGIVVFDTITIAINGCVEIPNDRDLVEVVDGVDCSSCIQKTCLESVADNVFGSNNRWDVEDFNRENLTDTHAVVVGYVIDDRMRSACVPVPDKLIANHIAVIIGTADIVGIETGVNIPTTNQRIVIGGRIGCITDQSNFLSFCKR